LSYYSDASLARALKVDLLGLSNARRQLIAADLIAYQKPLYQVLEIAESSALPPGPSTGGQVRTVGDILRQALGGAA